MIGQHKNNPKTIIRTSVPFRQHDCFRIISTDTYHLNEPIHYHENFELVFLSNARGVTRRVGDHVSELRTDHELVLIGPNLPHGWDRVRGGEKIIKEFAIQWPNDLFDDKLLRRHQFSDLRHLLDRSNRGLAFSQPTIQAVRLRIESIQWSDNFDTFLELIGLLHQLALDRENTTLSRRLYQEHIAIKANCLRTEKALAYMKQHYGQNISLANLADLVNMTEGAFSRFIKKKTGQSFIETLTNIRINRAVRLLVETSLSVNEIAFQCGFQNLSNFNRLFKKAEGLTPTQFRAKFMP